MTREQILEILKRHLPDWAVTDLFDTSNMVYTTAMHVSGITHNIIDNIMMLPEQYSREIASTIGIDEYHFKLIQNYLELIRKTPYTRTMTRTTVLYGAFNTAVVLVYRNMCAPYHKKVVSYYTVSNSVIVNAMANVISMEVYPSYTYYYTVISTILMLLKHLFITFCHLIEIFAKLPRECMNEFFTALNCDPQVFTRLRKLWLINQILDRKEECQ